VLKVEVSYRGLVVVGLALLSIWTLVRLWPVVLLVVTAFIFMAALLPYVEWLVRHGFSRVGAVLLVLLIVLLVIAGLVALLVPALVDEFQSIRDNLPDDAARLEDYLSRFGIDVQLQQRARDIDWGQLISGRAAFSYGQQAVQGTLSVFTVIVMTVYLLIDTPRLKSFLFQFVPEGREPDANLVLEQLSRVVGGYIRGQVITSVIIAVYTLAVLLILGVPNAFAFAALAGFADIIPLIGAFVSVLPASFAAFHESPTKALIVLGLLLAYQQFEDRFLVPRVYSSTLNLPPIIVLLAVLAGGELLGIPGILLSLPAAAVGRVALDYYLEHRNRLSVPIPATEEPFAPDR
jgi:predicted PurR-regulated permease PerM